MNAQQLEQFLDARISRKIKSDDRALDRREVLEAKAERRVGELCREGKTVYYCYPDGGKYFESAHRHEVIDYLIRNKHVTKWDR